MVDVLLMQGPDGTPLACGGCGSPLQNFKVAIELWASRDQMMVMCAGEWTLDSGRPVILQLLEVECPKCGSIELQAGDGYVGQDDDPEK